MKYLTILLFTLLSLLGANAQEKAQVGKEGQTTSPANYELNRLLSGDIQNTPRLTISLLTCEPSNSQIYTAWGHTAVRVQDPVLGIDIVFNYGIFSFDELGKFIYKFVKGETDYMLGVGTYQRSKREAAHKNAYLYEQELNLTDAEKVKILNALFENAKPENRYYRYNFFFDNCATRPRVLIEESMDSEINYPESTNQRTYRDIIHELLKDMKWYTLGIDLCMGSPTDEVVTGKDILFLPVELMNSFDKSTKANGEAFVKSKEIIYTPINQEEEKDFASCIPPIVASWILLFLILIHTFFYSTWGKGDKWFDALLFGVAGLVGFAIFLLSFFSEHPCTFPNFNLLWINPLQLIFAFSLISKKGEEWKRKFHLLNLGLICVTLLLGWTVQRFNPCCIPLMLCLALRSLHWVKPNFFNLRQKKANQI